MFTVYIDDSGTDPKQAVAIASGLIMPSARVDELDNEWRQFLDNEFIGEFHASECMASQEGTDFEDWPSQRKKHVCYKVREITRKYAVKAYSFAINKADYDEFVTEELRQAGGRYYYTWAIRHLIANLDAWTVAQGVSTPFEYIFDWMGSSTKRNAAKKEIEVVMAQAESIRPGYYERHYSFRHRKDHPGLQCADLLAWSCYQFARSAALKLPTNLIARETFWDYDAFDNQRWLIAVTQKREDINEWAKKEMADPRSQKRRGEWLEAVLNFG
jgi:hypothetical protein